MGRVPKVIWKKLPAPMSANGRPKNVPGATFYLRHSRNYWEPVGKDPDAAMAAKRRREIAIRPLKSSRNRTGLGKPSTRSVASVSATSSKMNVPC